MGGQAAYVPPALPFTTTCCYFIFRPEYCATSISPVVHSVVGGPINYIYDIANQAWYGPASGAPTLRQDANGYYAEAVAGNSNAFVLPALNSASGGLTIGLRIRFPAVTGAGAVFPFNTYPGTSGAVRGVSNCEIQYVDTLGNPSMSAGSVANSRDRICAFATNDGGAGMIFKLYRNGTLSANNSGMAGSGAAFDQTADLFQSTGVGYSTCDLYAFCIADTGSTDDSTNMDELMQNF